MDINTSVRAVGYVILAGVLLATAIALRPGGEQGGRALQQPTMDAARFAPSDSAGRLP